MGESTLDELNSLFHGFAVALTFYNLMLMLVGVLLGVLIGVLPGLGGANGVAILLPLTFSMNPTSAIIMLSCIYWGALFGGAITSILFNIPGEPWSVATTFDGYPLAQQGRAGEALTARVHVVVHRRVRGGGADHVPVAAGGQVRAQVRAAGVLRGVPAHVLQLRRHEQGLAVEDAGGDDARLRPRHRRPRHGHRPAAPHVRLHAAAQGLRLPDRGDRSLRHRRDPAHDGGGPRVQGHARQDRSEGRAGRRGRSCRSTG